MRLRYRISRAIVALTERAICVLEERQRAALPICEQCGRHANTENGSCFSCRSRITITPPTIATVPVVELPHGELMKIFYGERACPTCVRFGERECATHSWVALAHYGIAEIAVQEQTRP